MQTSLSTVNSHIHEVEPADSLMVVEYTCGGVGLVIDSEHERITERLCLRFEAAHAAKLRELADAVDRLTPKPEVA